MTTDVPRPPVDPVVWTPPPDPGLVGPFERNQRLADAQRWPVPDEGPEDVVVADDGTVYTGTSDGSILALRDGGDSLRRVARTGGRPLGLELGVDGRLVVCDADRGLLAVDPDTGAVDELVTHVDGAPLVFTNNATVGDDGTIWFTESSRRFSLHHYRGDLYEHSGTGRLLQRDPDGVVTTLMDGLHFANGVTRHPDGDSLLVAEMGLYRIVRTWPDDAGRSEVFARVPGFPDNLSTGPTGTIWCGLVSARNALLDLLSDKPPGIRRLAWNVPDSLQPSPARMALVFGFDGDGNVTHNLQSHGQEFTASTGVREHGGALYVGSLVSRQLLRHPLPPS